MTKVIGLYGGVGAGKTTVGREFASLGTLVVVADEYAHEAYKDPAIRRLVRDRFGDKVFQGAEPDLNAIADLIFEDAEARKAIEAIIHPYVQERIMRRVHHSDQELVVLDVPLLASSPFQELVNVGVFIDTPLPIRQAVCAQSRGWDVHEHARREKAQISLDEKRALSQYVIHNDGKDMDVLRKQVREIVDQIRSEG